MPERLSVTDAARRYLISEKSIRNWLKDGLLFAEKRRVNGKMQYAIDPKELEKVMQERNMVAIPMPQTDDRIAKLERHLYAAENAIAALRQRVEALEAKQRDTSHLAPSLPVVEVSEGTVEVDEFKRLHNLHITQVRNVVGSATHLTKVDMHAIWQEHHTKTRFRECGDCPHE